MSTADDVRMTQEALGRLILVQLKGVADRQYFPTTDPDNDDDRIKQGKERADELRILRERFENIVTGILP